MVEDGERPLSVLRYRLTPADALAYERLPGEWSGWRKAAFILPLMAIGAFAGFIEDFAAVWWWASVAALLLVWAVVGLGVSNWRALRRARARAAREGQVEVEEWGDHLAVRSGAGDIFLAYETLGKVIVGDGHVFVLWPGGSLILPLRAFDDPEAMRAFGEAVDRRSAEAAP